MASQNGMNIDGNVNASRRNDYKDVGGFPGPTGEGDRSEEEGRVETVIGSLTEVQALMRELGGTDLAEVEKDVARTAGKSQSPSTRARSTELMMMYLASRGTATRQLL